MNYPYRIAFLGKRQIKDYRPSSRFEIFNDTGEKWQKLVESHGDVFKKVAHRLKRVDGKSIVWYSLYDDSIMKRNLIDDLGQECAYYAYDTETQSIIFIYDYMKPFEAHKDEIGEFIDSFGKKLVFR